MILDIIQLNFITAVVNAIIVVSVIIVYRQLKRVFSKDAVSQIDKSKLERSYSLNHRRSIWDWFGYSLWDSPDSM